MDSHREETEVPNDDSQLAEQWTNNKKLEERNHEHIERLKSLIENSCAGKSEPKGQITYMGFSQEAEDTEQNLRDSRLKLESELDKLTYDPITPIPLEDKNKSHFYPAIINRLLKKNGYRAIKSMNIYPDRQESDYLYFSTLNKSINEVLGDDWMKAGNHLWSAFKDINKK